jgi:molybdopterin converting factor small subunit
MAPGARITITVRYHNILRHHTGLDRESLDLPEDTQIITALRRLTSQYGPGLREMLLSTDGGLSPHLAIFVNQQLVFPDRQTVTLADGDELSLFPTISGG